LILEANSETKLTSLTPLVGNLVEVEDEGNGIVPARPSVADSVAMSFEGEEAGRGAVEIFISAKVVEEDDEAVEAVEAVAVAVAVAEVSAVVLSFS